MKKKYEIHGVHPEVEDWWFVKEVEADSLQEVYKIIDTLPEIDDGYGYYTVTYEEENF